MKTWQVTDRLHTVDVPVPLFNGEDDEARRIDYALLQNVAKGSLVYHRKRQPHVVFPEA